MDAWGVNMEEVNSYIAVFRDMIEQNIFGGAYKTIKI